MICNSLKACIEQEIVKDTGHTCVNSREGCIISSDDRSEVKCEERRKKYVLKNTKRNHVICYKVDGGIVAVDSSVPPELKKCDYLYAVSDKDYHMNAILAELKGVDVGKALVQLYNTLKLFPDVFKECGHVYARAIVTSAMPNLRTRPEYVKLAKLLKGTYHGNLKVVEKQFCETDMELERAQ